MLNYSNVDITVIKNFVILEFYEREYDNHHRKWGKVVVQWDVRELIEWGYWQPRLLFIPSKWWLQHQTCALIWFLTILKQWDIANVYSIKWSPWLSPQKYPDPIHSNTKIKVSFRRSGKNSWEFMFGSHYWLRWRLPPMVIKSSSMVPSFIPIINHIY